MDTKITLSDEKKRIVSELFEGIGVSEYHTLLYQVEVVSERPEVINFRTEFDAIRFVEKLAIEGISHTLRVVCIRYHEFD